MCCEETIPDVDWTQRVVDSIEITGNCTTEARDVYALASTNTGTNDEIVDGHNNLINTTDAETMYLQNLDGHRVLMDHAMDEDYDNLFDIPYLSRRSERPIWRSTDGQDLAELSDEAIDMMRDWAMLCFDEPDPKYDEVIPNRMWRFTEILEEHMPAQLTVDTWICGLFIQRIAVFVSGGIGRTSDFCSWEPHFGDGTVVTTTTADGQLKTFRPFIGPAEPGRLIWRRPEGFNQNFMASYHDTEPAICNRLRQVETTLVALARRIARQIAVLIVYEYLEPEYEDTGRAMMTRVQLDNAVREILGEEWFHLPFDLDGTLRDWCIDDVLKVDEDLEGTFDVFLHPAREDERGAGTPDVV